MKRRDFLVAPALAFGAGTTLFRSGRAFAVPQPIKSAIPAAPYLMLRLDGSTGTAADAGLVGRDWRTSWELYGPGAPQVRISLHGIIRGRYSLPGSINIEAAYFAEDGGLNTATLDVGADYFGTPRSKPISFQADTDAFAGFLVNPRQQAGRGTAPTACAAADTGDGRLCYGLYVMVPGDTKSFDPLAYVFSGDCARPLVARNGRAPDFDHIAFSVGQLD
jgi:hypothetical protein